MNNNNITTTITNVMKNIKNVFISNKPSTTTSLPINTTTSSTTDDQNDALFVTSSSMNINNSMNKSIRNDRKIRGTYRIDTSNKFIHDGSTSSSRSRGSNNSNDGDRRRGNAGDGVDIADCVNISKCDSMENNSSNNNSSIGNSGFYSYINNSYISNYMNRSSHIQGIGDDGDDDDDESGNYSSNVNIDQSSRYYNSDNIISQHNGIIEVINHTIHDIIYQTNNYMNKSSIYINNMIMSSTISNIDDDSFLSSPHHSQHNQHNYYGLYDRQHIDKGGDIYGEKENVDYLIPLITNSHLINDDDSNDHNDESFSV
jgi:hypothetical protein